MPVVNLDEALRHHVAGEVGVDMLDEVRLGAAPRVPRRRLPASPQAAIAAPIRDCNDHCGGDGRMRLQHRLDLTRLDAMSSDLQLRVQPPKIF